MHEFVFVAHLWANTVQCECPWRFFFSEIMHNKHVILRIKSNALKQSVHGKFHSNYSIYITIWCVQMHSCMQCQLATYDQFPYLKLLMVYQINRYNSLCQWEMELLAFHIYAITSFMHFKTHTSNSQFDTMNSNSILIFRNTVWILND